jgi:4'-phosphopantetheinyl transferase
LIANRQSFMQYKPYFPQFIEPDLCDWQLDDALHLWRFPTQEVSNSILTDPEKELAARFRKKEDRNRFTTGRHALRRLLSRYLRAFGEIELCSAPGGKPFLSDASSNILFNLSHSGEWILIALATADLGVDIEKINPQFIFEDLLDDHFSTEEKSFVRSSSDPVAAFYFLWTRKEALTKAWGTGLQENLLQVGVLEDSLHEKNHTVWTLSSFHLSAGYPAALAYAGVPRRISYFEGRFC